jgi:hypothetical protein
VAKNVSGSMQGCSIDGLPYDVKADADASVILTGWKNERIPHSNGSMRKMIRQIRTVEGLILTLNADDRDNLQRACDSIDDVSLQFTDAAGDTYMAFGSVDFENWGTADNDVNVILQPENEWTPFIA